MPDRPAKNPGNESVKFRVVGTNGAPPLLSSSNTWVSENRKSTSSAAAISLWIWVPSKSL